MQKTCIAKIPNIFSDIGVLQSIDVLVDGELISIGMTSVPRSSRRQFELIVNSRINADQFGRV